MAYQEAPVGSALQPTEMIQNRMKPGSQYFDNTRIPTASISRACENDSQFPSKDFDCWTIDLPWDYSVNSQFIYTIIIVTLWTDRQQNCEQAFAKLSNSRGINDTDRNL